MRLLHVVPTYLPATRYGGPLYSVHALCAALAERGHDVHVYTTNVDGPGVSAAALDMPVDMDGVRVSYFVAGRGRRLYRSPAMGAQLAASITGFDVIHLHSVFLWPTTVAAAVARRCNVPYVLSPRGMLVGDLIRRKSRWAKTAWIELFERRNIERAAAVHVTADIEAQELARLGLRAVKVAVIPNGIVVPAGPGVSAGADRTPPSRCVLFLGRINWKKGLDRLIPAMAHVPGTDLLIAGNDEENYTATLRALAERCGVVKCVRFLGPVYGADKWRLMATADVFALPSYSENFGIAALEAMACGVPVVVTPEVGLAATIREAGAGEVVEGDAESVGRALAKLIADPERRRALGRAGRKAAEERFSWPTIAAQMEALYLALPSRSQPGPVHPGSQKNHARSDHAGHSDL
jgi:glycosyltransferase involved in cell wall biosynthesis